LVDMSKDGRESSRVSVVTVPRAVSRAVNSLWGKQRRPARLPDHTEGEKLFTKVDIDDLLDSGSDDEPWEEKPVQIPSHLVESPTSTESNKIEESNDDDLDLSDSSLDFMKEDPLASSAESDWEKDSDADLGKDMEDTDLQDSDEDFLSTIKPKKSAKDDLESENKSGDDGEAKKAADGKNVKIAAKKVKTPVRKPVEKKSSFDSLSEDEPVKKAKVVAKPRRTGAFDSSTTESDEDTYI